MANFHDLDEARELMVMALPRVSDNIEPIPAKMLERAIDMGMPETARGLVENGCEISSYALLLAMSSDDLELAQMILDRESGDKFEENTLANAIKFNHDEFAETLIIAGCPMIDGDVSFASEAGFISLAKFMLRRGCPINAYDFAVAMEQQDDELHKLMIDITANSTDDAVVKIRQMYDV